MSDTGFADGFVALCGNRGYEFLAPREGFLTISSYEDFYVRYAADFMADPAISVLVVNSADAARAAHAAAVDVRADGDSDLLILSSSFTREALETNVVANLNLNYFLEPDVVFDGANGIGAAARATRAALVRTFAALHARGVDVRGCVLKTNMVHCGPAHADAADAALVGAATVRVFADALPPALPGVVFLSGGMSDAFATAALDAINRDAGRAACPWPLSFSFGRALQQCFRETWRGDDAHADAAQAALVACARRNSLASRGAYDAAEAGASTAPLHVAGGNRY